MRAAMVDAGIDERQKPFLALHLSGGTTEILLSEEGKLTLLGGSLDLHAGQLVDRTGVRLHMPFPAGPSLEKLAMEGTAQGLIGVSIKGVSCNMAGAESKVTRWIEKRRHAQSADRRRGVRFPLQKYSPDDRRCGRADGSAAGAACGVASILDAAEGHAAGTRAKRRGWTAGSASRGRSFPATTRWASRCWVRKPIGRSAICTDDMDDERKKESLNFAESTEEGF